MTEHTYSLPELHVNVAHEDRATISREPVTTPTQAARALVETIGGDWRETFIAVPVDVRNNPIGWFRAAMGGVDYCPVDPRVVFRAALAANASGVIIAHNHPSGDPTPSREDDVLTERLRAAGDLLGIPVLDHVVITRDGFYSYKQEGRWPE